MTFLNRFLNVGIEKIWGIGKFGPQVENPNSQKNKGRLFVVVRSLIFLIYVGAFIFTGPAVATFDAFDFKGDSQLEKRYFKLSDTVRCPKCQNQNIAGSNAMIAQDMRKKIHQLLMEGKSDSEIYAYMVERYGDFVLYKPPVRKSTWLLWFGPLLVFLGLCLFWWLKFFKSKKISQVSSNLGVETLTDAEKNRLASMTEADHDGGA